MQIAKFLVFTSFQG